MMKRRNLFLVFLLLLFGAHAVAQEGCVPRPKLVIGIVIDQMRWDYIYRYYNKYGSEGFKRFLKEGATCENTMLAHIPSYTAVGHTSIYTGSVPAIDGITSNDFVDQRTGKLLYCTADSTVRPIGTNDPEGMESPHNLWVTTVGDELHLATNFHSKVISISLKDRASILPGGKTADGAYWLDSKTGHFITSSYYMDVLPDWLKRFNRKERVGALLSRPWLTLYNIKSYDQSSSDDNRYERSFFKNEAPVFPIDLPRLFKEHGYSAIKSVPMGNSIVFEMAEAAIDGEQMGNGSYTDFLSLSCSSTDYVGHQFGVNAIETEDTYLRLDKNLGDFLHFLDKRIGKGNYTVFLCADHGAVHNYNFLKDHRIDAGGFDMVNNLAKIDSVLLTKYGVTGLVRSLENYQLNFNYDKIRNSGLNFNEVKQTAINYTKTLDGVLYVIDQTKISSSTLPDVLKTLLSGSYNSRRSGEVQILVKPGYYEMWGDEDAKGTTHGIWAPYDLHIPLLWMGWGIKPGQLNREVYMTDIAPTLSALLHIQMPNGCVGHVIPEILSAATLDK